MKNSTRGFALCLLLSFLNVCYLSANPQVIPADTSSKDEDKFDLNNSSMTVYTDFKGYGGNQPNGIVQTELKWWWDLFNPICGKKRKTKATNWFFVKNIVFPVINLSSMNDKFKGKHVNLQYDTAGNILFHHIKTIDLIKYSTFNISALVNVFAINHRTKKSAINFYIDGFGTIYNTELKDSSIQEETFRANTIGWGTNWTLESFPQKSKWSMRVSFRSFALSLHNNDIKLNYGPIQLPDNNPRNNIYYDEKADTIKTWNYALTLDIRHSPKKNKEYPTKTPSGSVFFRFSYYNHAFFKSTSNSINLGNNYMQVQVGIQKSVEDLLKFIKGDDEKEKDEKAKDDAG